MDDQIKAATEIALETLRQRFGTYETAALALGISRQALRSWRLAGRVSVKRASAVSRLTGIPRSTLRPDIFGPIEDGDTADAA